jgi:hypothetical protein
MLHPLSIHQRGEFAPQFINGNLLALGDNRKQVFLGQSAVGYVNVMASMAKLYKIFLHVAP